MPTIDNWIGPGAGALTATVLALSRIPRVHHRMTRLFDPVVRWWTRGALVDEVHAGELRALRQRVADVDIIEAYLVYVTRWMIDVQLAAARQGMQLPEIELFPTFKKRWLREHPDYL